MDKEKEIVQGKESIVMLATGKVGVSRNVVKQVVDNVFNVIAEALIAKQTIAISGFGTFKAVKRNARIGRNPRTGEAIQIPEKYAVVFKSYGRLKDSLNA